MIPKTLARLGAALALSVFVPSHPLLAQPAHGIAMYGVPALPPDFVSLPYANPDAPKGGRIIFGESGGFDSLNPFILKGNAPAGVSALTVETLLGRSYDEPFTLYGLLAESVETDAARSFVAFTLREEARFADGSPVTPEDVLWSFETLGTQGSPRYAAAWAKIAKAEKTGPRTVRFTFNTEDRELPLILGLRPILKKAQWDGKDFTVSSLEAIIGSGPYVIGPFEPGRFITYRRNPDWWGADLPFNRGLHNFDEVRYDYFGDGGVVFEAFKAGDITSYREANPAAWAANYGFPAVQSGQVVLSEIPHQRPSGIEGFVFNTRREIFADWRVREALIQAFNFEFINRTLTGGVQPRITSYFSNSVLGMTPGAPAQGRERALLAPFADTLLPGALDGYALPVSDGSEANRTGIREATRLLQEAGWTVTDGVLTNAEGAPFAFDILLVQGQDDMLSIANIYVEALRRLGMAVTVTTVDSAQYKERTNRYDFDMTHYIRSLSLSPGNEQMLYWGAAGVTEPGTRNWMGMNSPAAEAMIRALLTATDPQEFIAATRALDRVLTSGRYVVPIWYSDVSRIAHARQLQYPDRLPIYGDWLGFQPDVWWYQD
ncbi:MAG: ABC transporter substrate-binding protein [Rhodobacter sp.]|nr:ABC transporter substrate-binding protein [Rhodobacter sp.]MCA3519080.1 ABC transporter substrate-binding protein [Rhodobacter sp.]MCA3522349.1 ABC transporter substrate-binding protein [Rhodobacter sp.]MCA3527227.1 ABC transporter substrate-binding protein [Rhodobacter sp.]MCA3527757.1 ABC transporter substrate-binding protein [Rhodobacter sp.]